MCMCQAPLPQPNLTLRYGLVKTSLLSTSCTASISKNKAGGAQENRDRVSLLPYQRSSGDYQEGLWQIKRREQHS